MIDINEQIQDILHHIKNHYDDYNWNISEYGIAYILTCYIEGNTYISRCSISRISAQRHITQLTHLFFDAAKNAVQELESRIIKDVKNGLLIPINQPTYPSFKEEYKCQFTDTTKEPETKEPETKKTETKKRLKPDCFTFIDFS